jgi:hypothetical protein
VGRNLARTFLDIHNLLYRFCGGKHDIVAAWRSCKLDPYGKAI